ncbi:MAG: hypothetical protein LUC37_05735 [Prevotella sp.]|nr:hypothetical protein [Prevotella sp.]
MRNKTRKRIQRQLDKAIRIINQSVESDKSWAGRFYVRQKESQYYKHDSCLRVTLEFVDKQANYIEEKSLDYLQDDDFFVSDLFWEMNDFIIKNLNNSKEW